MTAATNVFYPGTNNTLKSLRIRNLGATNTAITNTFKNLSEWGTNSSEVPDAR
jgi:hypothetical protein